MGAELPPAEAHARYCGRALKFWMTTLAIGIRPETRDKAVRIWTLLTLPRQDLAAGIAAIQEIDRKTAAATGSDAGVSLGITEADDWLAKSMFVPKCVA